MPATAQAVHCRIEPREACDEPTVVSALRSVMLEGIVRPRIDTSGLIMAEPECLPMTRLAPTPEGAEAADNASGPKQFEALSQSLSER